MIKIKNRCCYTVTLILCGTLFLTGLTGCKSREAQFLIDGLQEAKAEMAGASDGQMNGSAGTGQNTGIAAQAQQDNRININTADVTQLTTLTGIGATRAQAIIAYRQENGPFAAIEDIMNVQGIKEGTFAKIKDEIVVG